jgi:hypothetical protein
MRIDISATIASTVTATILNEEFSTAHATFWDMGERVTINAEIQHIRHNTHSLNVTVTANKVTESILSIFYNMGIGDLSERLALITDASTEAVKNYKTLRRATKYAQMDLLMEAKTSK